jgi:deoxyribodipyrimidine photo-lyase
MTRSRVSVHWFRRDLRLHDNHGLYRALTEHGDVLPLFIFDTRILGRLEDPHDRRVDLIHRRLHTLREELASHGGALHVEHGDPLEVWQRLTEHYDIAAVTANHDHEPYARDRDAQVEAFLAGKGIPFLTYKDISIFERAAVLKDDGTPYTVYTPYMKKWRAHFKPEEHAREWPSQEHLHRLWQSPALPMPALQDIGFQPTDLVLPAATLDLELLRGYHETRDIPAVQGTSRMSVNLRFGIISVRELVRQVLSQHHTGADKYLNELIWREFYMQILWHFPRHERAFKPAYDKIAWRQDEEGFQQWCEGRTGYPLVDAGMRELNATGIMHNRVRMVAASFLTKHLLIDWRWGEAWFAQKLLDFELSTNNGSWQWAASTGCDAVPYFRIFNPQLQLQRYDAQLIYVKRWVSEIKTANYVHPMIVHELARERAIETYKKGLQAPETHSLT